MLISIYRQESNIGILLLTCQAFEAPTSQTRHMSDRLSTSPQLAELGRLTIELAAARGGRGFGGRLLPAVGESRGHRDRGDPAGGPPLPAHVISMLGVSLHCPRSYSLAIRYI